MRYIESKRAFSSKQTFTKPSGLPFPFRGAVRWLSPPSIPLTHRSYRLSSARCDCVGANDVRNQHPSQAQPSPGCLIKELRWQVLEPGGGAGTCMAGVVQGRGRGDASRDGADGLGWDGMAGGWACDSE